MRSARTRASSKARMPTSSKRAAATRAASSRLRAFADVCRRATPTARALRIAPVGRRVQTLTRPPPPSSPSFDDGQERLHARARSRTVVVGAHSSDYFVGCAAIGLRLYTLDARRQRSAAVVTVVLLIRHVARKAHPLARSPFDRPLGAHHRRSHRRRSLHYIRSGSSGYAIVWSLANVDADARAHRQLAGSACPLCCAARRRRRSSPNSAAAHQKFPKKFLSPHSAFLFVDALLLIFCSVQNVVKKHVSGARRHAAALHRPHFKSGARLRLDARRREFRLANFSPEQRRRRSSSRNRRRAERGRRVDRHSADGAAPLRICGECEREFLAFSCLRALFRLVGTKCGSFGVSTCKWRVQKGKRLV